MTFIILIFLFAVLTSRTSLAEEQCFTFRGDSYLKFTPGGLYNNADKIHYEFEFKTPALNGLLMYARGSYGDMEALFVRGGNLHYHLFNRAASGIGRESGAHFVSTERVDTDDWIKVHVYRSYEVRDSLNRPSHNKTGIEFMLNGRLRSYLDKRDRTGIDITANIYVGGFSSSLSSTVGNYTGRIKGIREEKNSYDFEYPTLNYKSLVDLQCDD